MILALLVVVVLLFVVFAVIGMALWAVLSTIAVGFVIGALGRLVIPGTQPIGLVATLLAGLGGSIVGGFLGQHVLGLGPLLTIVIEVLVSAALVVVLAGRRSRGVAGLR